MSDFLPEVIMDEAATTSLSDSESIEEITDREVVKVEEKNTIQEEDIFVNKDKLVIKEVVEEQPPPKPKEVKTKKKRVMTEEHKAKLAQAREKALAKRRENAARKKEIKQLQKEEEEQKYQQLKERVRKPKPKQEKIMESSGVIEEEVKKELKKTNKNYTQEDLDNAVLSGIMKYEVIRKDRKKKKREQNEINKHEENVRNQVRQIINKPVQDYNFYDNCY